MKYLKLRMKQTLLTFVFGITMLPLLATDYYVAKDGNDSNSGTAENPFLTISKAAAVMVAGDVCLIKAGVYRETLSPNVSGTAQSPIVFKAFEQDSVVIAATDEITGWTVHSGNIYKATATMSQGEEKNALYADGVAMDIARWPNDADGDPFTLEAVLVSNGSASHIGSTSIPNMDWTDGYVWYLGAHSGASWTRKITSSQSGRVNYNAIDIQKWPFNPHNPTKVENGNSGRFYLFGKLEALDFEKEWFYDGGANTIYFQAPGDADPNSMVTEIAARSSTVSLGKNYITVDGLNMFGGRVHITGNNCEVKNCTIKYGLQTLDELNNVDAQMVNGAVSISGDNNLIDHNLIEFGSSNGVALLSGSSSVGNTVNNNVIRYFNTLGIHSNGIRSNAEGTIVTKNTIYGCGRDGIYVAGANGDISYNDVFDCLLLTNDGGVFYTVGNANDKNTVIHHNWFHDSEGPDYADGRAAGIYLDNHSKGYMVHHNVVWNVSWSAVQINWDNFNIGIHNNSFFDVEQAMGRWANGFTIKNVLISNNYSSIKDWIGTDVRFNLVDKESPFASTREFDFSPKEGSILINTGIVLEGITDGFAGNKPDVGAYELGVEPWVPGADWIEPDYKNIVLSVEEELSNDQILVVAPNPVNESVNVITNLNKPTSIRFDIYTVNGALIFSEEVTNTLIGENTIQLYPSLKNGMYLLKMSTPEGSAATKRILKQ